MAGLFDGFEQRKIALADGEIFALIGGAGPALLLLHGYPQCHVMWHKVAPRLAEDFTLVIADLRGYGASMCPPNDPQNLAYSKRVMAQDMVEVMAALDFPQFMVAGHDRGGRVGYRMALDHPNIVSRLAVLDIIPTHVMWESMRAADAMKVYHWMFLAQPHPLPENLIEGAPRDYQDRTIASWTKNKDLSSIDPEALAAYNAFFEDPVHIHAACNDYRAGQTCDFEHDAADLAAGRKIDCPVLALWGDAGIPAEGASPLDIWRDWARDVSGHAIDSGHFVAEENPKAVSTALCGFFLAD